MRLLSREQIDRVIADAKSYTRYKSASDEDRLRIIAEAIEESVIHILHCLTFKPENTEGLESKMITVVKRNFKNQGNVLLCSSESCTKNHPKQINNDCLTCEKLIIDTDIVDSIEKHVHLLSEDTKKILNAKYGLNLS